MSIRGTPIFDPHYGFARVDCDGCAHGYLLAYSCKTRYICPSGHQKRVLRYGEWVEANEMSRPDAHHRADRRPARGAAHP